MSRRVGPGKSHCKKPIVMGSPDWERGLLRKIDATRDITLKKRSKDKRGMDGPRINGGESL